MPARDPLTRPQIADTKARKLRPAHPHPARSPPRRRWRGRGAPLVTTRTVVSRPVPHHRTCRPTLGRPPGTVRGWLRAFARRADAIASCARRWTHAIDPLELEARGPAAGSPVADAVDALGAVTRACRLRLGRRAPPWELAVALTGGLLHGQPRDPGL